MTPEAQHRAIAEACGKAVSCAPDPYVDTPEFHEWREWQTQETPHPFSFRECSKCPALHIEGERFVSIPCDHEVPDYLNDFNTRPAMISLIVAKGLAKDFEQLFGNTWYALTVPQPMFCKIFLLTLLMWVEAPESQPV